MEKLAELKIQKATLLELIEGVHKEYQDTRKEIQITRRKRNELDLMDMSAMTYEEKFEHEKEIQMLSARVTRMRGVCEGLKHSELIIEGQLFMIEDLIKLCEKSQKCVD